MKTSQANRIFYFLLLLSFSLSNYNCSEHYFGDNINREMEVELIAPQQINLNWDSTIYQHNSQWNYSLVDTAAIDSLANLLKNSVLHIEDMWYPNEDTFCMNMMPIRTGSEIIIKLNKPDSRILNYGFQNNDGGFPIGCFNPWRHYKYLYK